MPNYEGPFIVKKAFSGWALILTNMDREELSQPVNADRVKKYYAWNTFVQWLIYPGYS